MIENFTTSSKGSETSKNSEEKKSFELFQNSNGYSFDYLERIFEYSVNSF